MEQSDGQDPLPPGGAAQRPTLPERSKELLRTLAEELLVMHGNTEGVESRLAEAEARAAALQQKLEAADAREAALQRQLEAAGATEAASGAHGPAEDGQNAAQLQSRILELTQRAEAAEAEAAQARQACLASQQQAEAAQQSAQRAQQAGENMQRQTEEWGDEMQSLRAQVGEERRLRQVAQAEVAELRRRLEEAQQAQQQQQQQQQQQEEEAPPQEEAPQQPQAAVAPGPARLAAGAAAPRPAAIVVDLVGAEDDASDQPAGQLQDGGHSSEDDETIRESAGAAGGAEHGMHDGLGATGPAPGAARGLAQPPPQAPATGGAPRAGRRKPTPQHLSSPLQRPSAQRKRQADGAQDGGGAAAAAALHAAAGGSGSAGRKKQRGSLEGHPASPGESSLAAANTLRHHLRPPRNSGGGTAMAAGEGSANLPHGSPAGMHAGSLLLSLKGATAGLVQGQGAEEEQEGGRRRQGRRSGGGGGTGYSEKGGVSGGGVVLRENESAAHWLNRHVSKYVGSLLESPDFAAFRKPVSEREVPGYSAVIAHPMDLGTIKDKASKRRYRSPDGFTADLRLVVDNAREYNENPRHPVHQAAVRLWEALNKPHSFFLKVHDEFSKAETEATLAEEKARQERELQELERSLADSVHPGLNVAVYAEDDVQKNLYYLLRTTKPVVTMKQRAVDDFGTEVLPGDKVVVGNYYDYFLDDRGRWDRTHRPYYLQSDKTAYVPADSLLLVDYELSQRKEPETSPYDGLQHRVYLVSPEMHQQLRREIKRYTAEPTVELGQV